MIKDDRECRQEDEDRLGYETMVSVIHSSDDPVGLLKRYTQAIRDGGSVSGAWFLALELE